MKDGSAPCQGGGSAGDSWTRRCFEAAPVTLRWVIDMGGGDSCPPHIRSVLEPRSLNSCRSGVFDASLCKIRGKDDRKNTMETPPFTRSPYLNMTGGALRCPSPSCPRRCVLTAPVCSASSHSPSSRGGVPESPRRTPAVPVAQALTSKCKRCGGGHGGSRRLDRGKVKAIVREKRGSTANEEDEDVSRAVEAGEPASFVFPGRRHYLVE